MALCTCCWLTDVIIGSLLVFFAVYGYFRYKFGHWNRRGIPSPIPPKFPIGNFTGIKSDKMMDLILADIYEKMPNEKLIGCYLMAKPVILIRDVDLIKSVLVKNFSSFHDRFTIEVDPKKDPLGAHLFIMSGQPWRNLRIKLTPTFTSGKMKLMFPILNNIGKNLSKSFDDDTENGEIELKEILSRFTTDIISSAAFGFEANSLANPDAIFRKMGHQLTYPGFWQNLLMVLFFACPSLAVKLPFSFMPKHVSQFFVDIVRDTVEYRTKNKVHRNDFMQLMVELINQGYVKDADHPELSIEERQKFTIEQAASQAYLFFFAGYETSSSTMLFALYELALNPDLQKNVQAEIDEILTSNNGELSYEAVMQAPLLDRVVSETLRKYPVAATLLRECNQEFPIADSAAKLLPGDSIWISIYGLHHDVRYYPDPETFDPDRFLPENKESRPHYAYIPFGEGPRNCIGNRFGLMQTKTGLAVILSRHSVTPSKRTPIPVAFDPKTAIIMPKGKMYLKVEQRV